MRDQQSKEILVQKLQTQEIYRFPFEELIEYDLKRQALKYAQYIKTVLPEEAWTDQQIFEVAIALNEWDIAWEQAQKE